jgi:hypothetical protein
MKRLLTLVLAITLFLGQAPAWALDRCMTMAETGLACVRVCTKSADLLTQHGKLPSVGQVCAKVVTRYAQPSVASTAVAPPSIPVATYSTAVAPQAEASVSIAIVHRAHAPPSALPAQAFLSVPVAQGPPAFA